MGSPWPETGQHSDLFEQFGAELKLQRRLMHCVEWLKGGLTRQLRYDGMKSMAHKQAVELEYSQSTYVSMDSLK